MVSPIAVHGGGLGIAEFGIRTVPLVIETTRYGVTEQSNVASKKLS